MSKSKALYEMKKSLEMALLEEKVNVKRDVYLLIKELEDEGKNCKEILNHIKAILLGKNPKELLFEL